MGRAGSFARTTDDYRKACLSWFVGRERGAVFVPRAAAAAPYRGPRSFLELEFAVRYLGPPADDDDERTGRWSADEKALFVDALQRYGRHWKRVAEHVGTRTLAQVRSHAQKYL
ncbi:hypothetical protein AURANDRAFT_22848, partial [Aureococcus anophagefferens]